MSNITPTNATHRNAIVGVEDDARKPEPGLHCTVRSRPRLLPDHLPHRRMGRRDHLDRLAAVLLILAIGAGSTAILYARMRLRGGMTATRAQPVPCA